MPHGGEGDEEDGDFEEPEEEEEQEMPDGTESGSAATAMQPLPPVEPTLYSALETGDTELALSLLQDPNADPNKTWGPPGELTSLMLCARFNNLEVASLLVQRRADLNTTSKDFGVTALAQAAARGHLSVLNMLVAARADVNLLNDAVMEQPRTPLQFAVKRGHAAVITALLEAKADPELGNSCDGTPLTSACFNADFECLEALVKGGANVSAAYHHCYPPLFAAAHEGEVEMVVCLLSARADPNAPCEWNGSTPILQTCWEGHVEVVRLLIAAKANLDVKRSDPKIQDNGATPLYLAAAHGHAEVVKLLIDHQCSVNASTTDDVNPVFAAVQSFNRQGASPLETMKILIQAGGDVRQQTVAAECNSPLHFAAQYDRLEEAKLLLEARADALQKAPDGKTPLDLSKSRAMRDLLESAAGPTARKSGPTSD